jgi:chitodextrinase
VALSWGASTDDVGVMGYEVWRGKVRATVASGRGFVDVSVPVAVEHCYTVVAFDGAGNRSEPAGPACVTLPDVTPPSVPARLSAKAPGETEILLGWDAASDDVAVDRYEVARTEPAGSQPSAPTVTGPAAQDEGLVVATRYCYAVRACDAAGNCSAPSAPACATTPDLTPPTPPSSATARAASDREIELGWPAALDNVGVAGYEVRRGGQVVAASVPEAAFRDRGLQPANEYCYTVVAFDAAGNRAAPSPQACAKTPDLTPPSVPEHPAATPVSASQVFVAWDPSTDDVGVAGYEVRRGSTVVANVPIWRVRDRGLAAQTEYCYTVVAYDAAGNRSAPTAALCARTNDPTQLTAPSDLRVRRLTATSLLLQWEPSEDAGVLYRVYAQGDRVVGVETTAGNIPTPCVVNAAGFRGRQVASWAGMDLPITNLKRHIFCTGPVPAYSGSIPFTYEVELPWYMRREGPGLLIGMGGVESDEEDPAVDWSFLDVAIEHSLHRAPLLEKAGVKTGWAGLRPCTPDDDPILGPAPHLRGFYNDCGWGGHGIMHSPAGGLLLAEWIVDGKPSTLDASLFGAGRFA